MHTRFESIFNRPLFPLKLGMVSRLGMWLVTEVSTPMSVTRVVMKLVVERGR